MSEAVQVAALVGMAVGIITLMLRIHERFWAQVDRRIRAAVNPVREHVGLDPIREGD